MTKPTTYRLRALCGAVSLVICSSALSAASVVQGQGTSAQTVPITVDGDEFDAQKTVFGPLHKQDFFAWQVAAIKPRVGPPALKVIIVFRWVDNGLLKLGTLVGASFKGGAPAQAVVGAPEVETCNSVGCLYEQYLNVSISQPQLKARMEPDGLPIKIVGTRLNQIIKVDKRDIEAVLAASRAL